MKSLLLRLFGVFLALAAFNIGSGATAPAPAPDPLLGKWIWHHNILVEFKADGTATSDVNSNGTWEFLKNAEVQRKYHVNWDHGKYIDTIILNADGKTAHLISKLGKFDIRRATD